MELGAVVLVVVGAVHGSVSHGDDPGTRRSVLRPVGLLRVRRPHAVAVTRRIWKAAEGISLIYLSEEKEIPLVWTDALLR